MNRRLVWIWPALIALGFTLIMVQWSFDRFRLNSAPFLDDVNWIDEGIVMLNAVRDGGLAGLVHYFVMTRTLAPYSIVAAAGFSFFGMVDWAPYAMNGWLIFCLLAFLEIARRREGLRLRAWFLAAAVALAFPICGYSVVSFLGDNATGLFLAIGSIAFLQGWPASESHVETWTGTLAWIFAFYGKATLFPEASFLFVLTAVVGCALTLRGLRKINLKMALVRRWAARAAVVLAVVAPYYILVAHNLYAYLYLQNYGALQQVWAFKGTRLESLLYYVTGFSGETMLGAALYLAIALLLLRAAIVVRESATEKLRFAALLAIIAFTYALPTAVANKTPTVGSPFQFLLVLVAVSSLYAVLARVRSRGLELLVALAVLVTFRFPQPIDARDSPAVAARNHTINGLLAALEAQQLTPGDQVFLTSTGYVSVNTLRYEFFKHGLPMPRFSELSLSNDASQFAPLIDQATFVIATDSGNDEVFYTAPAAFVQDQTLAMVQRNPALIEAARFSTWRGKHYYLFGRRERVRQVLPPEPDIAAPHPLLAWGFSDAMPDQFRWTRREFAVEFPAPRGIYAELTAHFFVPQPSFDKLGPITLEADIPREGRRRITFTQPGFHDFTCRYAIKQHLVSTVLVRFRLNKALPPVAGSREDLGILFRSAELNPIPQM